MRLSQLIAVAFAIATSATTYAAGVAAGSMSRADMSQEIVDTLNNRIWLGWDYTKGYTLEQTIAETAAGGRFAGYRLGGRVDAQLFTDAILGSNPCTALNNANCSLGYRPVLEDVVGESYTDYRALGNAFDEDLVWFLNGNESNGVGYMSVLNNDSVIYGFFSKQNDAGSIDGANQTPSVGWLLYRDVPAVPEPSPALLAAVGLVVLALARRKPASSGKAAAR